VRNYAEEEDPEQEEVAIDEAFCMSAPVKHPAERMHAHRYQPRIQVLDSPGPIEIKTAV